MDQGLMEYYYLTSVQSYGHNTLEEIDEESFRAFRSAMKPECVGLVYIHAKSVKNIWFKDDQRFHNVSIF